MLVLQFSVRTISSSRSISDLARSNPLLTSSSLSLSGANLLQLSLISKNRPSRPFKLPVVSCKSHRSSNFLPNGSDHEDDRDYLEASLLLPETIRHYHARRDGFHEEITASWRPPTSPPYSFLGKNSMNATISQGVLRRYKNPTMFLKVSCDGDFLLPIVVGEAAIRGLIDALLEDEYTDYPNEFQFLRKLVAKLGYEVNMVRITQRVSRTYIARIYLVKPGEKSIISVDARPSDAINVAKRCKAPIYVNKEIVLADAIRITYGMGRPRDIRTVYDVTLDSPEEGPDMVSKELDLVNDLKLAISEERYKDAAICRDRLMKLRNSRYG